VVAVNVALTAARTLTLPAANAAGAPPYIIIVDEARGVTSANKLTIQRAGSDTINGGTSIELNSSGAAVILTRNGTNAWTAISTGGGGSGAIAPYRYVATADQTTFSGADANGLLLSYIPDGLFVIVNGVTQIPNTYTAINGNSVTLGAPLKAGDVVVIYAFSAFNVANTWTRAEADARYASRLVGYRYIATGGQTVFSGLDANSVTLEYALNALIVTINGVIMTANTYTATNGTSVVFNTALAADDVVVIYSFGWFSIANMWTKTEADGRYDRITTSPTALTNGATIPSTENGRSYSMALPTVQTATLPSTSGLMDGFSIVVQATGLPAGYQTSSIAGNGKNILYRNSAVATFFLIGNGEIFRFTWLSGLDQWVAECLQHPGEVRMSRSHNGTTYNSGSTAWTDVLYNLSSGAAPFNITNSGRTLVPVIGVYQYRHRVFMAASAGGGTDGTGYLIGTDPSSGTANSTEDYVIRHFELNVDSGFLNIYNTRVLLPGDIVSAQYSMSVTTLWHYPGNAVQVITLVSR
jgi:hypothetical protein